MPDWWLDVTTRELIVASLGFLFLIALVVIVWKLVHPRMLLLARLYWALVGREKDDKLGQDEEPGIFTVVRELKDGQAKQDKAIEDIKANVVNGSKETLTNKVDSIIKHLERLDTQLQKHLEESPMILEAAFDKHLSAYHRDPEGE